MQLRKLPNVIRYAVNAVKIRNTPADHIADYDIACQTYDDYYGQYLGKEALKMLENTQVTSGGRYVDLACGTGAVTIPLLEKAGQSAKTTAVDLSSGMLEKCRQNIKSTYDYEYDISYVNEDASTYLQSLPSASLDGVFCAWGLCYMDKKVFMKELSRTVKTGGFVSLIENSKDTLQELFNVYADCLIDFPTALVKTVNINLPKKFQYYFKTIKKRQIFY